MVSRNLFVKVANFYPFRRRIFRNKYSQFHNICRPAGRRPSPTAGQATEPPELLTRPLVLDPFFFHSCTAPCYYRCRRRRCCCCCCCYYCTFLLPLTRATRPRRAYQEVEEINFQKSQTTASIVQSPRSLFLCFASEALLSATP